MRQLLHGVACLLLAALFACLAMAALGAGGAFPLLVP